MQSHIPIFTILKPAKKLLGERPAGGWHSVCKCLPVPCACLSYPPWLTLERRQDYPYRPGRFVNNEWPDSPLLGVQYNICVDAFYPGNGATQFMP